MKHQRAPQRGGGMKRVMRGVDYGGKKTSGVSKRHRSSGHGGIKSSSAAAASRKASQRNKHIWRRSGSISKAWRHQAKRK